MKRFVHSVNFLFVLLTNLKVQWKKCLFIFHQWRERNIPEKCQEFKFDMAMVQKEIGRKKDDDMRYVCAHNEPNEYRCETVRFRTVVVAEVSSLFSLWHEMRHCHINSLVLCVLISAQFSMPFFCNWHSAMCVPWASSGEAVRQAPPCTFIFGLKSRGDITAIPFVRILCHLFIKRKLFI